MTYYDKNNELIEEGDCIEFEDGTRKIVKKYENEFGAVQYGVSAYNPSCAFSNPYSVYPLSQFTQASIKKVKGA